MQRAFGKELSPLDPRVCANSHRRLYMASKLCALVKLLLGSSSIFIVVVGYREIDKLTKFS